MDAPCIARVLCGRQTLAASSKLESETRSLVSSVTQETLLLHHTTLAEAQRCGVSGVSGFVTLLNTEALLILLSTN